MPRGRPNTNLWGQCHQCNGWYTYDVVSKSTKDEESTTCPTYGDCGDIEECGYQLSLAHSSLLIELETPSSLSFETHDAMSGTLGLREEPLETILHEE